jgi:hypothetical protein
VAKAYELKDDYPKALFNLQIDAGQKTLSAIKSLGALILKVADGSVT